MNRIISVTALLALISCTALELGDAGGKNSPGAGQRHIPSTDSTEVRDPWLGYPFLDTDTTLYLTAISRDSTKLYLLKNWKTALSLDIGAENFVSEDPDLHHIVSGHLYTEFRHSGGTVVCRDGEEVLRTAEKYFLAGILERGEDLYLLGTGAP